MSEIFSHRLRELWFQVFSCQRLSLRVVPCKSIWFFYILWAQLKCRVPKFYAKPGVPLCGTWLSSTSSYVNTTCGTFPLRTGFAWRLQRDKWKPLPKRWISKRLWISFQDSCSSILEFIVPIFLGSGAKQTLWVDEERKSVFPEFPVTFRKSAYLSFGRLCNKSSAFLPRVLWPPFCSSCFVLPITARIQPWSRPKFKSLSSTMPPNKSLFEHSVVRGYQPTSS